MNEIIVKDNIKIEDLIYEVGGKQVMLDSDLAILYQCKNGTKEINQAVKNNIDKFPERFCFRISEEEYNSLKSKILTSKGGSRKGHNVFTEEGVAMLATILHTKIAAKVSVAIMDAFVAMRKFISSNLLEQRYIKDLVLEHDYDIKLLKESFSKFEEKRQVNEIYFSGQIYDAYSKIKDILKEAKKEIIIIDVYADKTVLDIIKDINVNITLIVKTKTLLTSLDINRYNSQYNNLTIIYNDSFHDRYFILDNSKIYHCGTSINKIGSKTFSINITEDDLIKNALLTEINKIIKKEIIF